jgi:hypothetical protein
VTLLLDHYLLLLRLCRPRRLRLWWCLLLACLQYKLDIVEATAHFFVVRLISLYSSLNMNCWILLENIYQWYMALIAGNTDREMYFFILYSSPVCQTLSNAWATSRKITVHSFFLKVCYDFVYDSVGLFHYRVSSESELMVGNDGWQTEVVPNSLQ